MGSSKFGYDLKRAEIDVATTGDHTLVAANTGHEIRVVNMFLRTDDVVTIQFKDGSTAIGGSMQMTDGDVIEMPINEYGWFETTQNAALVLNLTRDKQVSGWVGYFLV